ncbi:hypothetical protein [Altererythrobacter lauratis]|uniref:DUF3618 domain-containing protein n=1 Tax=Alteraurantiacibacter lauratis TaxID=2054627 RepID=A0ABV7EC53_9SPHN
MSEDKRQQIKERITAAQARHAEAEGENLVAMLAEKATEAKDQFTSFARRHPVATVAGGLALGVLVSALFRNSPTRRAGAYAGTKAAGLAALASEAAIAFAAQALQGAKDAGRAGADLAEDVGDKAHDAARKVRRETAYRVSAANDAARSTAREIGKTVARSIRRH